MTEQFQLKLLFSICFFLLPCFGYARSNVITDVLITPHRHFARLTIETEKKLAYSTFYLHQNPRLVIDAKNTKLLHQDRIPLVKNSAVKNIRYALKKNKELRLVFDLTGQFQTHFTTLPRQQGHPYRVIIDLTKPSPVALSAQNQQEKRLSIKRTISAEHAVSARQKSRNIIIVIDPGHGGKDPGAIGSHGAREKNVVLQIAKKLQKEINKRTGFRAVLTRNKDYYLTLRQRLAYARKQHADLFIAIHADAYMHKNANGASVYALSMRGATSEAARWLARKENESELVGGLDLGSKSSLLKSVLLNLSQAATLRASLQIGEKIIQSLGVVATLHKPKVEQAAFVVLKSPDIPSLLVETGFISNYHEASQLSLSAYQLKLARALTLGIVNYFSVCPPRGTFLALQRARLAHRAILSKI